MDLRTYLEDTTHAAVAQRARMSRQMVSRIAKGETPTLTTAIKLHLASGGSVEIDAFVKATIAADPELQELAERYCPLRYSEDALQAA